MTSESEVSNSARIWIGSEPAVQRVMPGDKAIFALTIENRSGEAQSQTIGVRGIPTEWCGIDFDDRRKSFPGERRSATLIVSVPVDADGSPRSFLIVAQSGADQSAVECKLEVLGGTKASAAPAETPPPAPEATAPLPAPGIQLTPAEVTWDGDPATPARVTATVRNVGSQETEYVVEVDGLLAGWFTLPPKLRIPAGEAAEAQINIHPPARARAGDFAFTVRASVEGQHRTGNEAKASLTIAAPVAAPPRRPTVSPPTPAAEPVATSSVPVLPPDVTMAPRSTFRFGPGEVGGQAIITITNKSRLIERYLIKVDGIPEQWYGLSTEELRLDPGASQQVPLRLTPRTGAGMPAGEYAFRVRIAPHRFPDSFAEVAGLITIAGQTKFDARLVPAQAEGRKEKFKLTVNNTGDLPISLWMEGSDSEGMCRFKFPPPPNLDPGEESIIPVWVGARRNGLLGQPETFDFKLKVAPAGGVSQEVRPFDARLIHRPFLGTRFAGIVLFLGAVIAAVGMFIAIGSSKVEGAFSWIGCQIDNDYQPVKGKPGYTKQSCGGRPEAEQDAARNIVAAVSPTPQATAGPTETGGGGANGCVSAANLTSGGKARAVSNSIRMRVGAGPSEAQLQGNPRPVLDSGDTVSVLEGPQCAGGFVWWRVRKDSGGQEGWVAEGFGQEVWLQPQ